MAVIILSSVIEGKECYQMALEMQNIEVLSPPVVKKITWWTLVYIHTNIGYIYNNHNESYSKASCATSKSANLTGVPFWITTQNLETR